jgi:hypothetical protein
MSKMFNYDNINELIKEAMTWEPLDDVRYDYALKFIFGEIDGARRTADRARNNGTYDQKKFDGRIRMLKSLAATIARLPVEDTLQQKYEYDPRAHQECYP